MNRSLILFIYSIFLFFALNGCGGGKGGANANALPVSSESSPNGSSGGIMGPACHGTSNKCLALRYAVYQDGNGQSIVSESQAVSNLKVINSLFGQCGVQFQIDDYVSVPTQKAGLRYNPSDGIELSDIRKSLSDDDTLLVVTTGTWNRQGSLGNSGANAWTSMPGEGLYGAILERPVGTFANIIAHEIGHYLNLLHAQDSTNLMNPVIYDNSTRLTSGQCSVIHAAISKYWSRMVR